MNKMFNNKGAISILIALSMVVLMGFAAISIDVGWMLYNKSRLQNATDAAALAGVRELLESEEEAKSVAEEYMVKNMPGFDVNNSDINSPVTNKLVVKAQEPIEYFFAKVFNIFDKGNTYDEGIVHAESAAITGPLKKIYGGLKPFGIYKEKLSSENINSDGTIKIGSEINLMEKAGNSDKGNFNGLDLENENATNKGEDKFERNIIEGSTKSYSIGGEPVEIEHGKMTAANEKINEIIELCKSNCGENACTYDNHIANCPRIFTVPIVEKISGSNKEVNIIGFAVIFLEGTVGKGGNSEIKGRFIKEVDVGDIDPDGKFFGAIGVKLVSVD